MPDRTRILFICMGNICRSPLAEGVFLHKVNLRGVADRFDVDSAGTGGWHVGDRPDHRMRAAASERGITLVSRARQVRAKDFDDFDHLICMDDENREHILGLGAPSEKVRLLLEFAPDLGRREVPDPYYGKDDGFVTVCELVDAACDALIEHLLSESAAKS